MKSEFKTLNEAILSIYKKYLEDNSLQYAVIGSAIIMKMDESRCINISLKYTRTVDNFDAVVFELKNKMSGTIDQNIVCFREVFENYKDTSINGLQKYVWKVNNKYSWYGKPTATDLKRLVKELEDYINIWK